MIAFQHARVGLTREEATRRLAREGANVLPTAAPRSNLRLLGEVLSEPMLLLLVGAGGVYLLLGDRLEAAAMGCFVGLILLITFLQVRRTARALEALRDLSSPRARVLRGGEALRIPGAEVVRGDLLLLAEGDRVSADARLVEGVLQVDESLLTGEAAAVTKVPGAAGEAGGVHAGTLITQGVGSAEVIAVGRATRMGALGQALAARESPASPLQRSAHRLVRLWAFLALGLAVGVVLLAWLWAGRGLLPSLLLGVAVAMAIIPEEIPVVLSVFTALGAWRLSKQGVLTRHIPAVEALGAITVLAVDKTGTLTENRMKVARIWVPDAFHPAGEPLPEATHRLVEFSVLATPLDPFDPMEKALHAYAREALEGTEHLHGDWRPKRAYALTPDILAMTHVYGLEAPDRHLLAAKGAPEAILDLCHLGPEERSRALARAEALAAGGLRVLGIAMGTHLDEGLPESQHDFTFELLGFVALEDPLRPEVGAAVASCRAAGIRVLMMTGDHPATALAIARQLGLSTEAPPLLGEELARLPEPELKRRLASASVCARLRPEHKERLVRTLQSLGEVVAMTGDGVNDAPGLRAAHVGVAMGTRGTDVARETADLVLVDDSFARLAEGVRMGRRVYDNLARSVRFVYAVHLPVLGLILVPLVLKWPAPLLPLHLVLLHMLIDPACSLVLEAEPEAPDLMARPPRDPGATPFGARALGRGALLGLGVLAVLLGLVAWGMGAGWSPEAVRGALLPALFGSAFLLVLAARGSGPLRALTVPNARVGAMALGLGLALGLILAVRPLRAVLQLAPLEGSSLAVSGAALLGVLIWLEVSARGMGHPPAETQREGLRGR